MAALRSGHRRLGVRLDRHFHLGSGFEAHLSSILIEKSIFDAELSIQVISPLDRDLCFLRISRRNWLDNFFDSCGESFTRLFAHI
jgi:hypothetical protein